MAIIFKARNSLLVKSMLDLVENLVLPPLCAHCQGKRWGRLPLCKACIRALARLEEPVCRRCGIPGCGDAHVAWSFPFSDTRFLFPMGSQLSTLIHGFKYRRLARNLRFLTSNLRFQPELREYIKSFDLSVPVPLHPIRKRERGYNQSELIAEDLARQTGVKVSSAALHRIRNTRTQTRLDIEDRQKNLKGSFIVTTKGAVQGKRVLLVDDVFTTGSTSAHCAEALLKDGCESVGVFALAHVDLNRNLSDFERELQLASSFLT